MDIPISQLPGALTITESALMPIASVKTQSPLTYETDKISLTELIGFVSGTYQYNSLSTTSKTLIAAINEAYGTVQSKAKVNVSKNDPSSQASDKVGDLWFKYTGSEGSYSISKKFVKIGNSWVEF